MVALDNIRRRTTPESTGKRSGRGEDMFYRNTGVSQVEKLIDQVAPMGDSVAAGVRTRLQTSSAAATFTILPAGSART